MTAAEILAQWADPETGGTMPREVRRAALEVLREVEAARATALEALSLLAGDGKHIGALRNLRAEKAEARVKELEAEMERLRKWEDAGQQFLAERDLLRKEVERLSRDRGMLKEEVGRLRELLERCETVVVGYDTLHGEGASPLVQEIRAALRGGGE